MFIQIPALLIAAGFCFLGEMWILWIYMRTIVEINNLTKKRINPELVKKVVRKTVKLSGVKPDIFEISVVFVNEAEIRKINRKYRRKNKSTDVLSFCYDSGYNKSGNITGGNYISGEVILCPDVIAKNARENGIKFERELAFVLAHGVLHVLGWRHGARMYELQDEILYELRTSTKIQNRANSQFRK